MERAVFEDDFEDGSVEWKEFDSALVGLVLCGSLKSIFYRHLLSASSLEILFFIKNKGTSGFKSQ